MRLCKVGNCKRKHDSRGYCKRHYKSFMKYGNALQVEINDEIRVKRRLEREKLNKNKRKSMSRKGFCKVDGCKSPIKSRGLCEKHYARKRRNGTVKSNQPYGKIKTCLVIGCDRPHKSLGYCDTHASYQRRNGSPYLPNIIKLCGAQGCSEKHFGRGLCRRHYYGWRRVLKKNNLL